jgi:alginate O-acetyltransferase complex protein AlgI
VIFSSTTFLFGFLPLVLLAYFLLPGLRSRNGLLLGASLLFYAWGEAAYVLLLLLSIGFNTACGAWIERLRGRPAAARVLAAGVAANLLLLGVFKYANFAAENLDPALAALGLPRIDLAPVHLPIGISFFTFQAITYVVDVYRGSAPVARGVLDVALYISLFPQLIAGPIVRYQQVARALMQRTSRIEDVAWGVRRFVVGLGKKVLIANTLAVPADQIFAASPAELGIGVAWLGLACYALQIYFDFSGYSDMAIGLGRVFGFRFPENFTHPYAASSVREFWRRWHISLSTWFRDYLYIPLGGSRGSSARTSANLFSIFLLCGLWHGASWNFAIWGLLHGAFLALERVGGEALLARLPRVAGRLYTLGVVGLAWVFFRSDSLGHALAYLAALLPRAAPDAVLRLGELLQPDVGLALALGALGCGPWWTHALLRDVCAPGRSAGVLRPALRLLFLLAVGLGSAMALAADTHNPFIYFRF